VNATQEHWLTLSSHPSEVGHARRHVAAACDGLPRDVVEVAKLLTSELVTNAMEHGGGDIAVTVERASSELRVAVRDGGSGGLRAGGRDHDRTGGRGLMLVESLSASWGVAAERNGGGKEVWFRLRTAVA